MGAIQGPSASDSSKKVQAADAKERYLCTNRPLHIMSASEVSAPQQADAGKQLGCAKTGPAPDISQGQVLGDEEAEGVGGGSAAADERLPGAAKQLRVEGAGVLMVPHALHQRSQSRHLAGRTRFH